MVHSVIINKTHDRKEDLTAILADLQFAPRDEDVLFIAQEDKLYLNCIGMSLLDLLTMSMGYLALEPHPHFKPKTLAFMRDMSYNALMDLLRVGIILIDLTSDSPLIHSFPKKIPTNGQYEKPPQMRGCVQSGKIVRQMDRPKCISHSGRDVPADRIHLR